LFGTTFGGIVAKFRSSMAKRSKKKSAPARLVPAEDGTKSTAEVLAPSGLMTFLRAAVIIGVGLWIYSPAFHGDWLWDDDWYITNQPLLHDLSGLGKFWFQPGSWVEYYPIEETLLWIEWHLFGTDTLGYHLVTVALHLIDALLVWRLLHKLGLRKAWLGGLIFAVHPACVDSVAWIVETKNTLSLLPFLLAMGAWIDYEERHSPQDYILALALFLVAMLCKITMAPFPFIILLYAWWKRRRIAWSDVTASAPFLAVSLVLSWLTIACGAWYNQNMHRISDGVPVVTYPGRVALAGQSLAAYFAHCFWPVHLLPVYPQWRVDPSAPLQFLPWLVFAGVLYFLWRKRAGWGRHVLLGLGFFVILLAPFLGFTIVSYMDFTWIMDHFLYIPLIGTIGLVIAALGSIEDQVPAASRPALTGLTTALIALLAFESRGYAVAYTDEATLWGYTVEHNSQNWMAQDNLAKALLLLNRPHEAVPHFEVALQLRPNRSQTHLNFGRALVQMDLVDQGIGEYDRALRLNPTDPDVYNQKGVALLQSGRIPEALAQFDQATKLRPNYATALNNRGIALAQTGRLAEALESFNAALRIAPDDVSSLDNLGSALLQSGRASDARTVFQHALQVDPADPKAQESLEKLQSGTGAKP
jgi:Tfp pilus assembly protein PilF